MTKLTKMYGTDANGVSTTTNEVTAVSEKDQVRWLRPRFNPREKSETKIFHAGEFELI